MDPSMFGTPGADPNGDPMGSRDMTSKWVCECPASATCVNMVQTPTLPRRVLQHLLVAPTPRAGTVV